jgi:3-isopropylmalate/(R)-2-methylmalate dehydratase small subunit
VLNKPQYQGASILLARKNFGCGSSREHAPWALQQYGFKAVIAPSFADIFFNNSFKNGFLPIVLKESEVARLFDEVAAIPGYKLTIDLPGAVVIPRRPRTDAFRHRPLPQGMPGERLGRDRPHLRHADDIKAYEEKRKRAEPWIFS